MAKPKGFVRSTSGPVPEASALFAQPTKKRTRTAKTKRTTEKSSLKAEDIASLPCCFERRPDPRPPPELPVYWSDGCRDGLSLW
jgi:hypothetical protein